MRGLYSNLLDRGDGPSMRENLSQRPRGDFIVELLERGTKADLRELLYAIRPDLFGRLRTTPYGLPPCASSAITRMDSRGRRGVRTIRNIVEGIRPPALMTHTGLGWSTSGKGRSLEERAIFAGNRGRRVQ